MLDPKVEDTFKVLKSTFAAPNLATTSPALNKDITQKRLARIFEMVPQISNMPPQNFKDAFDKYSEIEAIQKIAEDEANTASVASETINSFVPKEMKGNLKKIGRDHFNDELKQLDTVLNTAMDSITQVKDTSEFGLIHFGLLSRIKNSTFLDQDQKDAFTTRIKDALEYIINNTSVLNSYPSQRQKVIEEKFKKIAESCSPQIAIKFAIKHGLVKDTPAEISTFAQQHKIKYSPK